MMHRVLVFPPFSSLFLTNERNTVSGVLLRKRELTSSASKCHIQSVLLGQAIFVYRGVPSELPIAPARRWHLSSDAMHSNTRPKQVSFFWRAPRSPFMGNGVLFLSCRGTRRKMTTRRRHLDSLDHWVFGQTRWVLRKTRWVRFREQILGWEELTASSLPGTRWGQKNSPSSEFETVFSETVFRVSLCRCTSIPVPISVSLTV